MSFEDDLKSLCKKHNIFIIGSLKIRCGDQFDESSFSVKSANEINYGYAKDTTGPFLICSVEMKPAKPVNCDIGLRGYIAPDYKAYECPVTGKLIDGRTEHRENLKRTGCRLLEKGEKEQAPKRRQEGINESAAKSARQIAETIARNWGG